MKLRKWLCLALSLVLILGVLSGCKNDTPDNTEPPVNTEPSETTEPTFAPPTEPTTEYQDPYPTQPEEPPQSYAPPEENRLVQRENEMQMAPSSSLDGYYFGSQVLMFYDDATGETQVLCQMPDCTHEESSCAAWLGETTSLMEYHGVLYFTRTEEAGAQLCTKDPETGEVQVLTQWDHPQGGEMGCAIQQASDHMFSMNFSQRGDDDEIVYWEALYDLDTHREKKIQWAEEGVYVGIMIFNRDYALAHASITDPQAPGGRLDELRLYSLEDDSYTVISSQEEDGFRRSMDPCSFYGNQMAILEGDTLYVYDLNTQEKREIITMGSIRNYWIADGKVFFAVKDTPLGQSSPLLRLYYVDLAGGTPTRLGNSGETLSVYFRILWEGTSFFVGEVLDDNFLPHQYIISKADYYTDNFAIIHAQPQE